MADFGCSGSSTYDWSIILKPFKYVDAQLASQFNFLTSLINKIFVWEIYIRIHTFFLSSNSATPFSDS